MNGVLFWASVGIVVYFYVGYPAIVAVLAMLFPKRRPLDDTATPAVTLLIAAYNEEPVIAGKLDDCLRLNYPTERLQVLVAADGSNDRTAEVVRRYADRGVELSYLPGRSGKMDAINRAMPLVRGEIVVFSDANNTYDPDALRRLVRHFADARVGAVGGAKTIVKDGAALGAAEGSYWRYESFLKSMESRWGCCVAVVGEILAVRRALFEPQPPDTINDDFFIAMGVVRRGYDVVYEPLALSRERVSATEHEEIVRRARMNMGHLQCIARAPRYLTWRRPAVAWQVASHKFLRPLVPIPIFVAAAAAVAAMVRPATAGPWAWIRLATPWNGVALGCVAAVFVAAALGKWTRNWGRLGKALYLATFLANSNYAALVGLVRYVAGRRTVLWEKARRIR